MEQYIKLGKRYKRVNISCLMITVFAVVAVWLFPIDLWLKILLSFIIPLAGLYIIACSNSIVKKVLHKECNPEKFYCISRVANNNAVVTFESMNAMFALGDFNRAAEYFKAEMQRYKKTNINKLNAHFKYAESLFFAGDYENCIQVSADFQNQLCSDRFKKVYAYPQKLCAFFESFIKKEYDSCIAVLDTLQIDTAKLNNLFKSKVNYYYAITYYYSGDTEKAKAYFEKIKDINENLYYTRKARLYLEHINEDKFLKMNFEEIPKYENAESDAEINAKASTKQKKQSKFALVGLVICTIVLVTSLSSQLTTKQGTAEAVISASMGFDVEIKAILPVENENAALCVFQNKENRNYLHISYLESYENGLYSYGKDYSFLAGKDGVQSFLDVYDNEDDFSAEDLAKALHKDEPFTDSFDRHDYYFGSGKKDITVVYRISRYKPQVPKVDNAKEFVYTMYSGKEKTYYIYVLNVEKENQFGYSAGQYS